MTTKARALASKHDVVAFLFGLIERRQEVHSSEHSIIVSNEHDDDDDDDDDDSKMFPRRFGFFLPHTTTRGGRKLRGGGKGGKKRDKTLYFVCVCVWVGGWVRTSGKASLTLLCLAFRRKTSSSSFPLSAFFVPLSHRCALFPHGRTSTKKGQTKAFLCVPPSLLTCSCATLV